jgi:hypothetical protein
MFLVLTENFMNGKRKVPLKKDEKSAVLEEYNNYMS